MMKERKIFDGNCEKKTFYAEAIDNFTGQKNGGFLKYMFKMQKKVMTGAPLIIGFQTIDILPQRKSKALLSSTLIIWGSVNTQGASYQDAVESRWGIDAGRLR